MGGATKRRVSIRSLETQLAAARSLDPPEPLTEADILTKIALELGPTRPQRAEAAIREALERAPGAPPWQVWTRLQYLAHSLQGQSRHEEALSAFERAYSMARQAEAQAGVLDVMIYFLADHLQRNLRRPDEAIAHLDHGLNTPAFVPLHHMIRALSLHAMGRIHDASSEAEKALSKSQNAGQRARILRCLREQEGRARR